MAALVECVPNFSEGRDRRKVDRIAAAIESVADVHVLDLHLDPDHNRSVITFAGSPAGVQEAALLAVGEAAERIDLTQHRGEHPRIGATDVVPFIPLQGVTLSECAALAHRTGKKSGVAFRYQSTFTKRLPCGPIVANSKTFAAEVLRSCGIRSRWIVRASRMSASRACIPPLERLLWGPAKF